MTDAVIFDLDGLLIDSKPVWRDVEITVFASCGIELTHALCLQTMGLRIDEVVAHEMHCRAGTGCATGTVFSGRLHPRLAGRAAG